MRLLGVISIGGSAPKPPGFIAFFRQNDRFFLESMRATSAAALLPIPAAEPVARVASQHCPIPSGSGRLIINRAARPLNEKAANGKYSLNFVSHNLAHFRGSH